MQMFGCVCTIECVAITEQCILVQVSLFVGLPAQQLVHQVHHSRIRTQRRNLLACLQIERLQDVSRVRKAAQLLQQPDAVLLHFDVARTLTQNVCEVNNSHMNQPELGIRRIDSRNTCLSCFWFCTA